MNITTSNTIIYCQNWYDTVVFYRDVLKLEVNFSNEWFVEFILNSQARLSIADQENASIKSSGGSGLTVCLQIDNIEIMHDYLKELGVHATPIKDRWGSKVFYVLDPEGNRLEFWS